MYVLPEACFADMETLSIMIQTGVHACTRLIASVQVSSANERHNPWSWSFAKQGQQKSFNEGYEKASLGLWFSSTLPRSALSILAVTSLTADERVFDQKLKYICISRLYQT